MPKQLTPLLQLIRHKVNSQKLLRRLNGYTKKHYPVLPKRKYSLEQFTQDMISIYGNMRKESMCQVNLANSDAKSVVAKVAAFVFGSNNDDVWNIVNGITRTDGLNKDLTFGRVRGFIAEQADQEFFLEQLGHGHDVASEFRIHVINTKKLTAAQRKERDKNLNNSNDQEAVERYYAAVDSIKEVFKYDLLKEKSCK
jgi:hypothetical protein